MTARVGGWIRDVDERGGGRLRRLHARLFVQGERWGDFFRAVQAACGPATVVLDAGAGQGQLRPRFRHARTYVGVDLGVGDATWDYSGLDAVADLAALPLATASVDVAVCVQVLEHVWYPHAVLAELARVLRPGGQLYLTTAFTWPQHQKPFDGMRFSSFGLRRLLEDAGFDVLWMWPMGGSWTVAHMQLGHALAVTRDSRRRIGAPLRPLAAAAERMVQYAKPAFYALDALDADRDSTLGFFVCAQRRGAGPASAMPSSA